MAFKYINLKNDFGIDRSADNSKDLPTDQELTLSWLRTGAIAGYPVLASDKRRIFIKLSDRMDQAAKDKLDVFELNDIEYMFLRDGFEKGASKPEVAKYVNIAEEALLNALTTAPETAPVAA